MMRSADSRTGPLTTLGPPPVEPPLTTVAIPLPPVTAPPAAPPVVPPPLSHQQQPRPAVPPASLSACPNAAALHHLRVPTVAAVYLLLGFLCLGVLTAGAIAARHRSVVPMAAQTDLMSGRQADRSQIAAAAAIDQLVARQRSPKVSRPTAASNESGREKPHLATAAAGLASLAVRGRAEEQSDSVPTSATDVVKHTQPEEESAASGDIETLLWTGQPAWSKSELNSQQPAPPAAQMQSVASEPVTDWGLERDTSFGMLAEATVVPAVPETIAPASDNLHCGGAAGESCGSKVCGSDVVADGTAPALKSLGTKLLWADSPEAAYRLAQQDRKLVFLIHVSGNFEIPGYT